ncbi:MAG: hypothetical protein GC185_06965 [Alphaproteobacteria bacterium]|nr:hypothetical protein [Alphaproteobacteria bacterium]
MREFKDITDLGEEFKDERRHRGDVKPLPPIGLPKGYVGKYPPRLDSLEPQPAKQKPGENSPDARH